MPPRLVITRRLPEAVQSRASESYDAVLNMGDTPLKASEILTRTQGASALLPCVADQIDQALIRALPDTIEIIANFGAGTDHIDLAAAKARGITVTNTPGVLTFATADLTMLMILGVTRRATEGAALLRDDMWSGWGPTHLMGMSLQNKRLGIFGMGRIGQAVAARARAFGMEIHYHSRTQPTEISEADGTYHSTLEGLLAHSDILSLHCSATDETRGIINSKTIAQLPHGAFLINTARGDIVDDDAVIEALATGQLAGVGLDVFAGEPNIDPRYREQPNAFLLPHLGSATLETRTAMGMMALDNLDAFYEGKPPPNRII